MYPPYSHVKSQGTATDRRYQLTKRSGQFGISSASSDESESTPFSRKFSEQLYLATDEYFDCLFRDIENAKLSIDIEVYIFADDSLGQRLLTLLRRKAKQPGMRIRVLVDGVGSMHWRPELIHELTTCGIEVKIYHPLPWQFSHFPFARFRGSFIEKVGYFLSKINNRNHRKLFVIDQQIAWTGSMNITSDHLTFKEGGQNWRDCGVRVTGSLVEALSLSFEESWQMRRLRQLKDYRRNLLLNDTLLRRARKHHFVRRLMKYARKRVWISNAYFSPLERDISIIKADAMRGIDVKIITSAQSDVPFFPLLSRTFYPELMRSGVRIYEYLGNIIHSKVILIDDTLIVGTSNFNRRSMLHDLELDIVLDKPESVAEMAQRMEDNVHHAQEIDLRHLNEAGWYRKCLSRIYRLFIHWL